MTMKRTNKPQRSPLALAVLALLAEEPMHPYRMQQLIKERGKDEVINVRQRASIYQTIDRLVRDGLVTVRETLREKGRPDRTIYEITEEGRTLLQEWLREMLSTPAEEFPEFPAALSFLPLLTVADVQDQLEKRATALEEVIKRIDSEFERYKEVIPRLFLLESEYKREVLLAELQWVRSIVCDIQSGELLWDKAWLREIAQRLNSPE
jgi:DNA-binding PadR family transcriptional regulator